MSYPLPALSHLYTLSLHDALPIYLNIDAARTLDVNIVLEPARATHRQQNRTPQLLDRDVLVGNRFGQVSMHALPTTRDRKSTRLNSSHRCISYAVFCLKKKTHQKI